MNRNMETARAWALSREGCPYIYGGTGQPCTVAYREARARQYPAKAAKIRNNCQRMKGSATSCQGCRWCDPETGKGKRAYDCAQLARWCMNAVGISLVSGANNQWSKTKWAQKGTIDQMPKNLLCLVYREDADRKKHHAGVYLGDDTIMHAKGHDYGVVRQKLGDPNFTHYGIPEGLYAPEELLNQEVVGMMLKKGSSGDKVMELQRLLNQHGYTLTVDGKFGAKTEAAVKAYQQSASLPTDGIVGDETWAALNREKPQPSPLTQTQLKEFRACLVDMLRIIDNALEVTQA